MSLYEKLTEYCATDAYPFHMPGHKRRSCSMQDPFSFDITEIDGFDNLHHAQGILAKAQKRAAELYHSSETHFLVNGSTAGILSAVSALVGPGGLLLMARNSHRSAYNAAGLRDIRTEYLYPSVYRDPEGRLQNDLNGPVDPSDVERALARSSGPLPSAIFLTSPTYDGVVSDVRAIADIAHRYDIPLIVDEAHGAHFGMHPAFPPSSVTLGADVVIHSLHKTLPSLTQTALLHINGDLADRRKLRSMLSVFQTSSPSYVLMASIDSCIRSLSADGRKLYDRYVRTLTHFYEHARFNRIEVLRTDDPSRILLRPHNMTPGRLYALLRDRYRLQPEMLTSSYVLLLSSVADSEEGFRRLLNALTELDEIRQSGVGSDAVQTSGFCCSRPVVRLPIFRALNAPHTRVELDKSAGMTSAEYLYLYPPGVPLLAPGEEITQSLLCSVRKLAQAGYELQGTEDYTLTTIWTLKEDIPER